MAADNKIQGYLKNMKQKLNAQEMSVMVGAGFSKNVNFKLYPSWWQLLADMIKHMHGQRFASEYEKITPKNKRPPEQVFYDNKIQDYINEFGFLRVASKYMDFRGYRESIDCYIEERTPYLITKENNKYLRHFIDGEQHDLLLSEEDLSAHRGLVSLPWINIYTTNYDNLLEECVDESIKANFLSKIESIEQILKDFDREIEENEANKIVLIEELAMIRSNLSIDTHGTETTIAFEQNNQENGAITEFSNAVKARERDILNELNRIEHGIEFSKRQIILKNQDLQELNILLKSCISVIIRSSQLALKKTKNIIKLHGSRRTEKNFEFGFDEDSRKQYVITQEDFDSYPQKHEAFTQLMRISLLQESFCLVGFSGDDPNFLAWIGWVRDVLFKDKDLSGKHLNEKIYLISISKNDENKGSDFGKSTFYQNQRIVEIPLLCADSINFLEQETQRKLDDRSNVKDVFNLLFEYLQNGNQNNNVEIALELSHRAKFDQICDRVSDFKVRDQSFQSLEKLIDDLHQLEGLTKYNRIPSIVYPYDFFRELFLNRTNEIISLLGDNETLLKKYLEVNSIFLNVQFYPLSVFESKNLDIDVLLEKSKKISSELYYKFLLAKFKSCIWEGNDEQVNIIETEFQKLKSPSTEVLQEQKYLSALYSLFRMDFESLKRKLLSWHAVDYWIIKKSALMSHYNIKLANDELLKFQSNLNQEKLYAAELYVWINISFDIQDTRLRERFVSLKDTGLNTLRKASEHLLNELKDKEAKIVPYGDGKYSIKNNFYFSNTNKVLQSIQFAGLMLDFAFPFSVNSKVNLETNKVYKALFNTMQWYWFPVIQITLQYNDAKFIKRIAQDLVLIHNDVTLYESVFMDLQKSYLSKDTPINYKENILVFITELTNVVHPDTWTTFFSKIWSESEKQSHEIFDRRSNMNPFLRSSIRLIQDKEIITKVIKDCLVWAQVENNFNATVCYLYELSFNPFYTNKAKMISKSVQNELWQLLNFIEDSPPILFLFGNLDALLDAELRSKVRTEIGKVNFNNIETANLFSILLHFIKGDKKLMQRIKNAILSSNLLWEAGFIEGGVTRKKFVGLVKLSNKFNENGIKWTQEELKLIFEKLVPINDKIKIVLKKRPEIDIFVDLLEEMRSFLDYYHTELLDLENYHSIYQEVSLTLASQRNFSNLLIGLASSDQNEVIRALDEIVTKIYYQRNVGQDVDYFDVLITKILLQKLPAVEPCLNYVSQIIYDFRDDVKFRKYQEMLNVILEKYESIPLENGELQDIEENLVRIAFVLDSWGVKNLTIATYLKLLNSSRFNSTKYNLSMLLYGEKS